MSRVTAVQWDEDADVEGLDERVFQGNNGSLVATVAQLYPLHGDVLDLTPGKALGFWNTIRPDGLVLLNGAAPDLGPGLTVRPIDFRAVPWPDAQFDHVVFDPPYVAKGGHDTSTLGEMNERYGMLTDGKNPREQWERVILPGLTEAARLLRSGGLLWFKCMDYVTGGKVHWFAKEALVELAQRGLVLEDEFILAGRPGPQPLTDRCRACDGTGEVPHPIPLPAGVTALPCASCDGVGSRPRRQVHAARAHSVLLLARRARREAQTESFDFGGAA